MTGGAAVQGDLREPCCRDEANLEVVEVKTSERGTLTTRRCVCGRRHFHAALPAIRVGVRGNP